MYKVFIENKEVMVDVQTESELVNYFSDHKFIEAAGGLVDWQNKYLFIKRLGFWDIPKGKLDLGETPEEAAVREVVEECGEMNIRIEKHLVDTWHTYIQKDKKYLKKTYWYKMNCFDEKLHLVPQTEENITEVKFFEKENLSEILERTYPSIKLVLEKMEEEK